MFVKSLQMALEKSLRPNFIPQKYLKVVNFHGRVFSAGVLDMPLVKKANKAAIDKPQESF